jgi:hypothetical protein
MFFLENVFVDCISKQIRNRGLESEGSSFVIEISFRLFDFGEKVLAILATNLLKLYFMSFSPNEGAIITLAEGAKMTANYRATISAGETIAHAVGKNLVNAVLSQVACVGIRFYYAINNSGDRQLVAVGVDANGDDMTQGVILDEFTNCPPECGKPNVLNTDMK